MRQILDITDARLTVWSDGQRVTQPGVVRFLRDEVIAVGDEAVGDARRHPRQSSNDHWYRPDTDALPGTSLTRADLVNAQLNQLFASIPKRDELVLVLPSYLDNKSVSLLLGILSANQLQPVAIVDQAIAATASRYNEQALVHIDISFHCASVSRFHQTVDQNTLTDARTLDGSGLLAMREAWIKFFAQKFVQDCRFDPLHSADTEQALVDQMPQWLNELDKQDSATISMQHAGQEHVIETTRVDVVNAVAAHYQRISDMTRAALAGGDTPALQMCASVAELPGFAAYLTARVGGHYFVIVDDAAVQNLAALDNAVPAVSGKVQKALPLRGVQVEPPELAAPVATFAPTHLVNDGVVVALSDAPLAIGAAGDAASARIITLEGQPPGVSALHCEIRLEGNQCIVNDHSRYGTFLNGNRVSGSASLQAGDVLRVGTPGVEFQLVREVLL